MKGRGIFGLPKEQIRTNGEKGGKKSKELGLGVHGLPAEEKVANGKKVWELGLGVHGLPKEQRQANGEKGALAAERTPNGLEGIVIQSLSNKGLFAENADEASTGMVYYAGRKDGKNVRYFKFKDNRTVIPDFKVKGLNKVIEIYGSYWHSEEYCRKRGYPDYKWNPERLIEEYKKVGYECRVYWESEIRNPNRRAEIVEEINSWVKNT